jgi:hypothetical protein
MVCGSRLEGGEFFDDEEVESMEAEDTVVSDTNTVSNTLR